MARVVWTAEARRWLQEIDDYNAAFVVAGAVRGAGDAHRLRHTFARGERMELTVARAPRTIAVGMMGPYVYKEARAGAPIHLQLWRLRWTHRRPSCDSVRVEGRVGRIFRDRDRRVHWGRQVSFGIPVVDRERTVLPS